MGSLRGASKHAQDTVAHSAATPTAEVALVFAFEHKPLRLFAVPVPEQVSNDGVSHANVFLHDGPAHSLVRARLIVGTAQHWALNWGAFVLSHFYVPRFILASFWI